MGQTDILVRAGEHERTNCPLQVALTAEHCAEGAWVLADGAGPALPCQIVPGDPPTLHFVLDHLGKGSSRTLRLSAARDLNGNGVELTDVPGNRVAVSIAGQPFTNYHYATSWARPFLFPIVGPYGDTITRHFPMEEVAGEAHDHPHHKSCWVAWGEVNGTDNWSETPGHARQVHRSFETLDSGPVLGRITARNDWVANNGEKTMEERRTLVFYNLPAASRMLDLTVEFVASEKAITFADTKEGGIASIRVASSMDAKENGTITNAYGGTNEKETWGKRAHWCDYSGPVNGKTVGVTIMDTPTNFRYPTYWHVRNYGLMTANPFGLSHFLGDKTRDGSHTIEQGAVFRFSYRLLFHAGDAGDARVTDRFLDYAAPPHVELT